MKDDRGQRTDDSKQYRYPLSVIRYPEDLSIYAAVKASTISTVY